MAPFDQEFYVASPRSEPTVSDDPVLERLRTARAMIAKESDWSPCGAYTWVDGRSYPSRCAVMAIADAGTSEPATGGAINQLRAALPAAEQRRDVINYNDDPRTTHADVLSLFDRAIAARTAELTRLG